ncbi:hypothetical protein PRUB_a3419 [Pseudoalteromonas rubra]|uniref:Uncharacterized protein n=1 Tax=Pseudoalteromonas rubra TaxID=43658 RepID=A0A8T0C304_9GAMM|nr:hypothetical protein [Pseudoalteromonas rubra]KAF7783602.1 hypothetical protein PRUB_a3419 [Pseudoalteromonas rubra]
MKASAIKVALKDLINKTNATQELFDKPYPGFTKSENLELISRQYSMLKGHLEFQKCEAELRERKNSLSLDEEAFWLPAITEAYLNLRERKGSKNEAKLGICLYDCSFILTHYYNQIDV